MMPKYLLIYLSFIFLKGDYSHKAYFCLLSSSIYLTSSSSLCPITDKFNTGLFSPPSPVSSTFLFFPPPKYCTLDGDFSS